VKDNRIRVELGGSLTLPNRHEEALKRSKQVLKYCFDKSSIWLRIILWDDVEKENLINAGLDLNKADLIFEGEFANEKVLYVYFREYSELSIDPVVISIINYETNRDPFANITCYFVNFLAPLVLNIYDDRGLDIFSPNQSFTDGITNRYNSWVI
jgi:hypothetical protein